jgi:hypothetical protein
MGSQRLVIFRETWEKEARSTLIFEAFEKVKKPCLTVFNLLHSNAL